MKKNIFNKIVNCILTERNMTRQIANNIIQNVGNKQNMSYNRSNKLSSSTIDIIPRKRNDGTTFNIKVEVGSHARYRINTREVDLKTLISIIRTAIESILRKNMSEQVIVDKQTCYVVPIVFDSSDMTIFLKTVSIFDGKQSYPIKKNASDTTVLNQNKPSSAWEEAEWIYETYGDKLIRGGGDPHHPSFIYKNYAFNPNGDANELRHGMPTTYKGYLALTDKEKKFVANRVKRKAVNVAYDRTFNTFKKEKEKQMNDMWADYFKKQNMKENKNVIRLSQKQLNEIITETINTLISEGLLDNNRSL